MTLSEYAASKNMNVNAIQERLNAGTITEASFVTVAGKRLIDADAADLEFEFLGDSEKSEAHEVLREEVDKEKEGSWAEDETGLSPLEAARKSAAAFKKAKVDTEKIRARKLELEIQIKEDKLLDAEEVRKRFIKIIGEVRDGILNVPGRVAPLIFGMATTLEIEKKLYEELCVALESLSRLEIKNEE